MRAHDVDVVESKTDQPRNAGPPTLAHPAAILALQRSAGNAAVCRALKAGSLLVQRDPHVHYGRGERDRARAAGGVAAPDRPGPMLPGRVFLANFEPGRATLSGTQITELRHLVDQQLASRGHVVEIIGYTDAVDDERVNVPLRQARADAVRDFLLRNGVPASRIGPAIGARPGTYRGDNTSDSGRAVNRGAELVLSQDYVPPPPPPPPPQRQDPPPPGHRNFRLRMLFAGAGAGDVLAVDHIYFEICDPVYQESALYNYTGAGIGAGIRIPRRVPLPRGVPRSLPGGASLAGPWNDFRTREDNYVGGFGGATRFTTAGGGPWSLNYLTMCGSHPVDCLTEPKTLSISTGFTLGVGMSTTGGVMVRMRDGDSCSCR